jgi:hypothetical protein
VRALVLVLAARASPYPTLIRTIKRTWGAVRIPEIDVLYYYGGSHLGVDGSELVLPCPDDLAHAGGKTIAAFDHVLRECEFDLVFRTNCSTYVDLPNLQGFACEEGEQTRFYAGKGVSHDLIDFAGGSGYFLSRDLVQLVVEKQADWDHHYLDDVALGKLLRSDGVERRFAPRVIVGSPREVKRLDLSQFHFRCKTDSAGRRGDIELMSRIHAEFGRARGSDAAANRMSARVVRRVGSIAEKLRGRGSSPNE